MKSVLGIMGLIIGGLFAIFLVIGVVSPPAGGRVAETMFQGVHNVLWGLFDEAEETSKDVTE